MHVLEIIIASTIFTTTMATVSIMIFAGHTAILESQNEIVLLSSERQNLYIAEKMILGMSAADLQPATSSEVGVKITQKPFDPWTTTVEAELALTSQIDKIPLSFALLAPDFKRALGLTSCTSTTELYGLSVKNVLHLDPANDSRITDIKIAGNILYVSSDSNRQKDDDLTIFDISEPENIQRVAAINTGPGIQSITVSRKYVYAANTSSAGQLQIINTDDPKNPFLLKTFKVSPEETAAGNTITHFTNYIFLGLAKAAGPELYIIDVRSADSPHIIATLETDTAVNNIIAEDERLLVATPINDLLIIKNNPRTNVEIMGMFSAFVLGLFF